MTKRRIPVKLQRLVKERALGHCEYCVCPESHATQSHSNEHIIPEALGGETIAALNLNRPGVINLRRSLFRDGLHPPAHRSTSE
ncbi:MAG: hypothetical protein AB7U82_18085 [Blastocatellales bacterium]